MTLEGEEEEEGIICAWNQHCDNSTQLVLLLVLLFGWFIGRPFGFVDLSLGGFVLG
jgi:hypothetical protein